MLDLLRGEALQPCNGQCSSLVDDDGSNSVAWREHVKDECVPIIIHRFFTMYIICMTCLYQSSDSWRDSSKSLSSERPPPPMNNGYMQPPTPR